MKWLQLILAGLVISGAVAARADEHAQPSCALQSMASLDTQTLPNGEIAVPATLNDTPALLAVDTGSIYSSISEEAAVEQGAHVQFSPYIGSFMNGVSTNAFTVLNSFAVGPLRSPKKWSVAIAPDQMLPASISGYLGPDVMRAYDVEFDFYHGKFNLFAHTNCAGAVYWTHDAAAVVPMKVADDGHIVVDATLDGKPVTILLDTGSPSSVMSVEAAEKLFGIAKDDQRLKFVRSISLNGGSDTPFYSFPFSSLSFGAITVANPKIQLIPQENFDPHGRQDAQIVLGMSVLRQLHLYVAYDQKMLYLSAAEAH
ncbi:MAG TPA: aspartyl protease family protein [Rhizomicrobium sp.]|nr:aspartyl protease family protein [Rhizomicrobium sp.]